MSLATGDLTTPTIATTWMGTNTPATSPQVKLFVESMSRLLNNKLNRARLFSQTFIRTLDGTGTYQLVLPDYPVTSIASVQVGNALIPPASLPPPVPNYGLPINSFGYGYRWVPWSGNLPGDPVVLEFVNGCFPYGAQNIKVTYTAGYLISAEANSVPAVAPYTVTVQQPQGICSLDNGVTYASTGTALTPVAASPGVGQYIPPNDSAPGLYTFNAGDANAALSFNYSFVPSDLTEACNQMVAERLGYTGRIGTISKSLGGQETMRWMRGGMPGQQFKDLPPEVEGMIWPYVSVIPPAIGAPV